MSAPAAAPTKLEDVLRALGRHHTKALVFEYLVGHVAILFRGSDSKGPTKLLQLPNGAKCRAEVEDVLEIEEVLRRLAGEARAELERLKGAGVVVPPPAPTGAPLVPCPVPEGEGVADAETKGSSARPIPTRPRSGGTT